MSSIPIDDNDPLELEAPSYRFEDRSQLLATEPVQLRQRDEQRELLRDAPSRNSRPQEPQADVSLTAVENLPRKIVQPEEPPPDPVPSRTSTGIGGPSILGLSYEDAGSSGFVYDQPRNDGFVYDTDGENPEYLLEETRRGVSWRAWLLLLLLAGGAALGYIQWRASRHEGPDIATILAGNGATVDPNGPVIPDKSAKPWQQKPSVPNSDASNEDSVNASQDASPAEPKDAKSTSATATSNTKEANAKDTNASSADENGKEKGSDSKSLTASAQSNSTASKSESNNESKGNSQQAKTEPANQDDAEGKPESDGPAITMRKSSHAQRAAVEEEPAQPKSLGDKDPLMIQADKYIQGRGVRQNCSAGLNLLREAVSAGNPAADVKLGALYWSGTCVTQSKVTAYQWFSRAHSMEPQNRWVERSRNSLWASMSSEEKRRIGE